MTDVRMNPEDLRRFARFLVDLEEELAGESRRINQALDELSVHWKDRKFQAYSSEFREELAVVTRFREEASRYVEHLVERALRADAYLQN